MKYYYGNRWKKNCRSVFDNLDTWQNQFSRNHSFSGFYTYSVRVKVNHSDGTCHYEYENHSLYEQIDNVFFKCVLCNSIVIPVQTTKNNLMWINKDDRRFHRKKKWIRYTKKHCYCCVIPYDIPKIKKRKSRIIKQKDEPYAFFIEAET